MPNEAINQVLNYLKRHEEKQDKVLHDLLRIPSVSTDPKAAAMVRKSAQYLKETLADIGCARSDVLETKGHPIVYAETPQDPRKPTVLFYGHYDVQPAEPLDLWLSPPFEPTIRGPYLFARGVADDKGQVMAHVQAIEGWLKQGECPVNVKFLIEGEEEIGSPNLLSFLKANKDLLKADVGLISDTPMFALNQPSLVYSLRGLAYMEVTVRGPKTDLHSGQHGGAMRNPIHVLSNLIAGLKDKNECIAIPGYYEDVRPIPDDISKGLKQLPFDESAYRDEVGVSKLVGEAGYSTLERRWLRPTIDCNGIFGGYTGEGGKTIVPAEASAKISMRLVADQRPERCMELVESYLKSQLPQGVSMDITRFAGANPAVAKTDGPAVQAALEALEQSFGTPAVWQGEGGSIPIVADFKNHLDLDCILMGFNLPDSQIHAPNERMRLDNIRRGREAAARFYGHYAEAAAKTS